MNPSSPWPFTGIRVGTPNLVLYLNHAIKECFGGGRTARHIDIDGHDTIASAHYGIGIMIIAAAIGTGPHGDHTARLGHLVVHAPQRGRHLVHARARHAHHVGLTRTRAEHPAETVKVITRGTRVHHLNGTAGATEGHRPQRARAGPVAALVHGRGP